jgi:hypothetical protein
MRARTLTLFAVTYAFELACLLIALMVLAPPYLPALPDQMALRWTVAAGGFLCFLTALVVATDPGLHLRFDGQEWRGRLGAKILGARHSLARKIALLALLGDALVLELTTQALRAGHWPSLAGLLAMGALYWLGAALLLKSRGRRFMASDPLSA